MTVTRGVTLIELLVTLAILAVLASVALPVGQIALQRSKEQELRLALREIRTALDAYKKANDEGRIIRTQNSTGYPKGLIMLTEGVDDARDPKKSKIYFLRRLPRDPFHPDPTLPPEQTWHLRSYASPPTAPKPGDDVFDVRSQSDKTGLNGVPYREW